MRAKSLLIFLAIVALLPLQAQAEVKSYDLDVMVVLNTTTLTVTGDTRASILGNVVISDDSNASPTLDELNMTFGVNRTTRTDVFGGLNSFVHTRELSTRTPIVGQTGTGDTEGFVKWNPLSSWTPLGGRWCKSSNEIGNPVGGTICGVLGRGFETTQSVTIASPTYDFPLWTFDAQGDFSSDGYLWNISSNGSSNNEYFHRGKLRIDIPAMSALGFAILGGGLIFLGIRTLRSRKQGRS